MTMNKITKQDIGKTFWVVPTGNNWCRMKNTTSNEPKEIVITDMRRTRGAFRFANTSHEHEFSHSYHSHTDLSIHIDCGFNGGYHIYRSLEDCKTVQKAKQAKSFISDRLRGSRLDEVPQRNVIEAAKLLGWNEGEDDDSI